jgi:histidine triad (HIT) family protein
MDYDNDNIFAKILRGEAPAHTVYEDDTTLAFLDMMPQADGHTLVLPKVPAANLFDLDDASLAALMRTTKHVAAGVREAFAADGIRLMQLNGRAAGQTVFHFHLHIIPCREGQPLRRHTGTMADNAVLTEHAARLRAALEKL